MCRCYPEGNFGVTSIWLQCKSAQRLPFRARQARSLGMRRSRSRSVLYVCCQPRDCLLQASLVPNRTSQQSSVLTCRVPHSKQSDTSLAHRANQLLDGSMSLSPLYPNRASDLHVNTATVLHRDFSRLQPVQAKFTIFRVRALRLKLPYPQVGGASVATPRRRSPHSFSLRAMVSITIALDTVLDSLVRVSRRVPQAHSHQPLSQ